jgi:small-conductance mechanosensitive channel
MQLKREYSYALNRIAHSLGIQVGVLRFANVLVFILVGVGIGLLIRHSLNRLARRTKNPRVEFLLSLASVLPIPLLVISSLYLGLQVLVLPHVYQQLWTQVLQAIVIVVLYLFPARFIGLSLRSIGRRKPDWERTLRFLGAFTEAVVAFVAIYTLLEAFHPGPRSQEWISHVTWVLAVCLFFYALAKVVILWLGRITQRQPELGRITDPARFGTRLVFAVLAAIIVLENFGVRLTAVWTTLGIGSVAVGLALQETLANFFAGMYILVDRPIAPGDFIQLDSGQQGYVIRVGWRSTLLRSLASNIVVVPNSTLGKAIITNYSRPELSLSISITVGVSYSSNPQRVKSLLEEIGQEAVRDAIEGLDPASPPSVQFNPGFGDSSLNFTLGVRVRQFTDQYRVQSELHTRIFERFAQEGIELPFPTRTIVLDKSTPEVLGVGRRVNGAGEPKPENEQARQP